LKHVSALTESIVQSAALTWLESLGWTMKHGPEIASGELMAERGNFGQVVLTQRLRGVLVRHNPMLPSEALEDALRNKPRREALANRFRNAEDPFTIVLARDMWPTGFDALSLQTMYVDKPMCGRGFMHALAI
jgi:type I site-specific restriction-modification system R (restriction) subunit